MFRRLPIYIVLFAVFAAGATLSAGSAISAPEVRPGVAAPSFTAPDISGRSVGLRDYAGKIIVLEWTNDGCPFCGKHYNSGNMQALQHKYTRNGVIWLTIASSAPGEQGYVTPGEAKADLARWQAEPTDFLLDPEGTIGKLYDARATPNIVVIGHDGRIAFMGAIDDTPSTNLADIKTAHNYVVAALDAITAGKPVAVAAVPAYGCSIKYKGE